MTRFTKYVCLTLLLAGCSGTGTNRDWYSEYGNGQTGTPNRMQYGTYQTNKTNDGKTHSIAVLLPQTGPNAQIGNGIRGGVELAVLQNDIDNLSVSFYDTAVNPEYTIKNAVATNPEIIIGPLFSKNAELLRDIKPIDTPAISFTSDANALGNGVLTVNLMPTNSIEIIIREMISDNNKKLIIIAPNNDSGKIMAGVAKNGAEIYGLELNGIFYYNEGDNESIKNTSETASMYIARTNANKRAREILSDIATNEKITGIEKSKIYYQIDKLSKNETIGDLPYNAVLFLGNANDSKSLGSFLRYYGVDSNKVRFYGTAMWDNTDLASDFTMSGAKYAAMPEQDIRFSTLYEYTYGTLPSRLATFGYDATNIAIGTIYSSKTKAAYLLDPSGYDGTDGIIRLKPNGDSERGLRIVELNASGTPRTIKTAPENFIVPLYNIEQRKIKPANAMGLQTSGINPMDYINIPTNLQKKYKSQTYGVNITEKKNVINENTLTILPEDDRDPITNPEYQPIKIESINKTLIDSVEIEE